MKTLTLITIALLALSGCSNETNNETNNEIIKETIKEEVSFKTTQYYLKHKDLRKRRLKECRELNKMTNIQLEDCNNAETAEMKSKQNKLIDL